LDGSVSCILEVVVAFCWLDSSDEGSDMPPNVFDGTLLGEAHPMLDLGEGLFDRIEVWRVGQQIPESCAGGLDHASEFSRLVGAEVVHDDDVTLL